MIKRLFCKHHYTYLGYEDRIKDIGLGRSQRIEVYQLHIIYCPKCGKMVKDKNKSHIDILLKKSRIDNSSEKLLYK